MGLGGPGGFKRVREADRKKVILFSPKMDLVVPSNGQKTKTTKKTHKQKKIQTNNKKTPPQKKTKRIKNKQKSKKTTTTTKQNKRKKSSYVRPK